MSVNKVILVGRVGKDPEVRYTASQEPIASFTLATSERRKDQSGQYVEQTEWHNVTCFKKTAEFVEKHIRKGANLYVEGSIKTEKYKSKDGVEKTSTKIMCSNVDLIGSKPVASGGQTINGQHYSQEEIQAAVEDDVEDDTDQIPF